MRRNLRRATLAGVVTLTLVGLANAGMAAENADSVGGGPASHPAPTQTLRPSLCEPPSAGELVTVLTTGRLMPTCRVAGE